MTSTVPPRQYRFSILAIFEGAFAMAAVLIAVMQWSMIVWHVLQRVFGA